MPENDFIDRLQEKGWLYKRDLYEPYFEKVKLLHEVEKPQISVVVISWRLHPDTIKNFTTLQKQREKHPYELIFVDNGGQPGEFDTLKPYIHTYIRLNQNTGAYLARNVGAIFCRAPIILFLEDDGITDDQLIESHLLVHRKYDVIAVRGVYLYKTENPLNERQSHYYLGKRFFPRFSSVEGNSSYSARIFFEVGGWDDHIHFGGGGLELALRLYKLCPSYEKQIYSPISIIYHDFAINEEHLEAKMGKQEKSAKWLSTKHKDWHSFLSSWQRFHGNEDVLAKRKSWSQKDNNYYNTVVRDIFKRNHERMSIEHYTRVFIYDDHMLSSLVNDRHKDKQICIFGTGSFGEKVYQTLTGFGLRVDCFSDNNSAVWNQKKHSLRIIPPQELTDQYFIFIASTWGFEISQQLEAQGLKQVQHCIRVC